MIVLGIDPGSYKTGYGILESNGSKIVLLSSGVIDLNKKSDLSFRLSSLFDETLSLINRFNPNYLSIEKAFYYKNVQSTLRIGEARAASLIAASKSNLEIYEFSPREIKKSVSGNGSASKEQIRYIIKKFFNLKFAPKLDESDAIAVALCFCLKNHKQPLINSSPKRKNKSEWKTFILKNPNRVIL
jgi:crossover junction endodeoxyribonuclease RuvC